MIARVEGEPCWWYSYGGEQEGPHFASREAADKALGMPPGGVLLQLPVSCHTAACDRCGYVEGQDDECVAYHFPAYSPQHVVTELEDIQPDGKGGLLCTECRAADEAVLVGEPLPGMTLVRGGGLR